MQEEYKVVKRIEITLETSQQEVAAYLGAYIDGIHDTCTWIQRVGKPNNKVRDGLYKWIVDLKERLNTSRESDEKIREDLERQIRVGLEYILRDYPENINLRRDFKFNLQVKEVGR